MAVKSKPLARAKILAAADELAREVGPAKVSLESVAARAGVSKGGLLYHFPSKLALLTALVEDHIDRFSAQMALRTQATSGSAHEQLRVYHDLSACELTQDSLPKSGVLAALVQFPELLRPVADFKRRLLDRMIGAGGEVELVLIVFLALEGLRSMQLLDMHILTEAERERAIEALQAMIGRTT
jgi:AcrR family transcriptional regulator